MDRQKAKEVGLRSTQESLTFQPGKAAWHGPQQNGDGTSTVGHHHGLARGHPSQDGARLATQLTDPDAFHVRQSSTGREMPGFTGTPPRPSHGVRHMS